MLFQELHHDFGALAKYNFFFVGWDYTMVKVSYTEVSTLKKKKKNPALVKLNDQGSAAISVNEAL